MAEIFQLNAEELRNVLKEVVTDAISDFRESSHVLNQESNFPSLIYGIKGLAEFLNVSLPTAQKFKNQKLFPCYQRGRTIVFKPSEVMRGMQKPKI